jgi:hypothetical protein
LSLVTRLVFVFALLFPVGLLVTCSGRMETSHSAGPAMEGGNSTQASIFLDEALFRAQN